MSGTSSSQTETNPVLASGLALVGLLGVAAALLPSDMLPVNQGVATETGETGQAESTAEPAVLPLPQQAVEAEPATPVFKPVELETVSDEMVQPSSRGMGQATLPVAPAIEAAADPMPTEPGASAAQPAQPTGLDGPGLPDDFLPPARPGAPVLQEAWPAWQAPTYPQPRFPQPYAPQPQPQWYPQQGTR